MTLSAPDPVNPRNTTNMNLTDKILRPLCLCQLAAILCSCAATSVKETWKSPDCQQPVGKIAVVTIEDRGLLRQGFENRFVAQLAKAGAPAVVTFDQLSLAEIKQDKQAAAARFRARGADAVLILRLADTSSFDLAWTAPAPRRTPDRRAAISC